MDRNEMKKRIKMLIPKCISTGEFRRPWTDGLRPAMTNKINGLRGELIEAQMADICNLRVRCHQLPSGHEILEGSDGEFYMIFDKGYYDSTVPITKEYLKLLESLVIT